MVVPARHAYSHCAAVGSVNSIPFFADTALSASVIADLGGAKADGILASACDIVECQETFVRGDANADGGIEISDAITILAYLFLDNSGAPSCLKSADTDASGNLNLTDAVYLLSFLFLGGTPPDAPFPECGSDLTH